MLLYNVKSKEFSQFSISKVDSERNEMVSSSDPFVAPIVHRQLDQVIQDFDYYMERTVATTGKAIIGIQGKPGSGKTTAINILKGIATEKEWITPEIAISKITQPHTLYEDILLNIIYQLRYYHTDFENLYKSYLQTLGANSEEDFSPSATIFEVFLLAKRGISPTSSAFKHDLDMLLRKMSEKNIPGTLFIINLTKSNEETAETLWQFTKYHFNYPCIFLIEHTQEKAIDHNFDKVYHLQPLDVEDIRLFLNKIFTHRSFDSLLPQQIYQLTGGKVKDTRQIIEEIYHLYTRENRRGELIKISNDLLDSGRLPDNNPNTSKKLMQVPITILPDLEYFLSFEGWFIRDVGRFIVAENYLGDEQKLQENALQVSTSWIGSNISLFAQREILRVEGRNQFLRYFLLGSTYQRLLIKALIEKANLDAYAPSTFDVDVSSGYIDSVLLIVAKYIDQNHGLKQIAIIQQEEEEVNLENHFNKWLTNLREGIYQPSTSFFIGLDNNTYLYKESPSEFLANMVDSEGESNYHVVGLHLSITHAMDQVEDLALLMLSKPNDETKDIYQKITNELESLFEVIEIKIKKVEQYSCVLPSLDDLALKAFDRRSHHLVNEIYSALRKAGVNSFTSSSKDKKPLGALNYFQRAVELPSSKSNFLDQGLALNNYAFTKVALEDFEEAISKWQDALSLFDSYSIDIAYTLQNLGYGSAKLKKYTEALNYCDKAIDLDDGRNFSVSVLYVRFCHEKNPIDDWRWELAYKPQVLTTALCTKAAVHFELDEPEAAFKNLLNALILSPEAVYVHRAIGWFYVSSGQLDKAAQSFEQARRIAAEQNYSLYPCHIGEAKFLEDIMENRSRDSSKKRQRINTHFVVPVSFSGQVRDIDHIRIKVKK